MATPPNTPELDADALAQLAAAKQVLEKRSLGMALAQAVGERASGGMRVLPSRIQGLVQRLTNAALRKAMDVAAVSLARAPERIRGPRRHARLAAASGAFGGAFGLAALAVELPLSTVIVLRAIADAAARHGEDLSAPETRLACMEVFALGGDAASDADADSAYFAIRAGLAGSVREAVRYMAGHGAVDRSAPVLAKLVGKLGARFSGPVANKMVAQGLPLIGAVGGAAVNAAFVRHYAALADAHFTVRALERRCGEDAVRAAYERIRV